MFSRGVPSSKRCRILCISSVDLPLLRTPTKTEAFPSTGVSLSRLGTPVFTFPSWKSRMSDFTIPSMPNPPGNRAF